MSALPVPATRRIVLLADDDPASRLLTESVLCSAGFDVIVAEDGAAAIREFEGCEPALVLLDVEMPGMDGFAVCERIRSGERHRDVPIVMVTGLDDAESVDRAYELGATDFITKPITWATLPHRLRHVILANDHVTALRVSEQRNRALLTALPDRIFIVSDTGLVVEDLSQNGVGERRSYRGCHLQEMMPVDSARHAHESLHATLMMRAPQSFEYDAPNDGGSFESRMVFHTEHSVLMIVRDITSRKRSDARIQQELDHLNAGFAHSGYYDKGDGVVTPFQFCLARRTPDGQATTVVNRFTSPPTVITFSDNDGTVTAPLRWHPPR